MNLAQKYIGTKKATSESMSTNYGHIFELNNDGYYYCTSSKIEGINKRPYTAAEIEHDFKKGYLSLYEE